MTTPVVALVADHAGLELKNALRAVLEEHRNAEVARDCLPTCLTTPFAGGRQSRRVVQFNQVAEPEAMSDRSPEVAV